MLQTILARATALALALAAASTILTAVLGLLASLAVSRRT